MIDKRESLARTQTQAETRQRDQTAHATRTSDLPESMQQKLRFFDLAADLMCVLNPEGCILLANAEFERVLGWPPSRFKDRPITDLVFEADCAETLHALEVINGGFELTRLEHRLRTRSGAFVWIGWKAVADVEAGLIFAIGRELTEHKHAESLLMESESYYRTITELMTTYSYVFTVGEFGDLSADWVAGNIELMTGFTQQASTRTGGWSAYIHPDDAIRAAIRTKRLLSGRADISEFRIVTASGEIRWLRDYARPITDPQVQRVVKIIGAAQDITKKRKPLAILSARHRYS